MKQNKPKVTFSQYLGWPQSGHTPIENKLTKASNPIVFKAEAFWQTKPQTRQ